MGFCQPSIPYSYSRRPLVPRELFRRNWISKIDSAFLSLVEHQGGPCDRVREKLPVDQQPKAAGLLSDEGRVRTQEVDRPRLDQILGEDLCLDLVVERLKRVG